MGIHDSFFELGGHSLSATRTLARLEELLEVRLSVRHLLEAPTIAGLTEAIARLLIDQAGEEETAAVMAELEG